LIDINTAVRFVDDYMDKDPTTRDSSPGSVYGKKLKLVAYQWERRLIGRGKIKHVIFVAEGTRDIWYKKNYDYPAVVKMGFSLAEQGMDRKSLPMEVYSLIFINGKLYPDLFVVHLGTSVKNWMQRNDFEFA
jgi:hypothetical protein